MTADGGAAPTPVQILPDHVANQIAAGEVVERPASVVKELVENALDAGARRIEVALRAGGKGEIRVSDDGCGMRRDDALLCLDRHATSKIRSVEELHNVISFGFRGEALPSIAAVSRFELETAPAGGDGATRIRVVAGRIRSVEETARRQGTTVTVRALFHSLPARAKFLRSAAGETRAVSETVVLLALANLSVAFRLESNGRVLLDLPAAHGLTARVAAIWGEEEAGGLLELDAERDGVRVAGLIQRPDAARTSGRRSLFVNGRPFRDPALLRMVDEAYRTTVAPGRRPAVFLYLGVAPAAVDVNVHPAKAEVRFRERERVEGAIREGVRDRLGQVSSSPAAVSGDASSAERAGGSGAPAAPAAPVAGGAIQGRSPGSAAAGRPTVGETAEGEPARGEGGQLAFFVPRSPGRRGDEPATGTEPPEDAPGPQLWQLHRAYILAATRQGLLVIDQHSAHERILYEEIMGRLSGGEGVSQRLLFPITLHLSPAEYSAAEELSGLLRRGGFEIEPFGDRIIIIHSAPHPHPWFDPERCFREMIRELTEGSPLVDAAGSQHERIAKSMACKGAIKAGQPLSAPEMAELFDRLFATELPGHDVHGRPTILRLTLEELARRFGRA